jgi:nucleotide-binding universal stress UspA family protein
MLIGEDNMSAHSGGTGRIIAGVDGSGSSVQALRWAARQARLTGAELHVIGVWNWAATFGYVPTGDFDWEQETGTVLDDAIKNAVDSADAVRVHKHIRQGHPAEVLLDASEGAELLVVGSRGHGGFTGMMLGSVSQHVVTHARCPVVVVHDTPR